MHKKLKNYQDYYRSLITLGVPIIIGQLGGIITGFADTIMVGQHSTEELAAASFVNNVINAFIILGTGFSFNLTPLIGESLARRKRIAIGTWLKNSLVANLSTTLLLLSILTLIYLNLDSMGQPAEIMPLIRPYFAISLFSIIFVMMANSFRQFVEGIANPSISMWVLLAGNLLNVAGNYLLIYGKCGLPEMGLLGAGISTLLSRIVMLGLFIAVFMRGKAYRSYRKGFALGRINTASWKKLNAIGWPIGLQQGLEAGTFCITAIMVGWIGKLELAAHQIAITVSLISFTIYLGLGAAVAIRTAYYKGAGNWEMVRKITLAGNHLALMVVAVICLMLFIARPWLGYLFTNDEEVIRIVRVIIPILMLYQLGDSIQIILTNALRGLADVNVIMIISLIANFAIAIPAGYALGFIFDFGIAGIWFSYPISFACSVIMLTIRARRQIGSHLSPDRSIALGR